MSAEHSGVLCMTVGLVINVRPKIRNNKNQCSLKSMADLVTAGIIGCVYIRSYSITYCNNHTIIITAFLSRKVCLKSR